MVYNASQWRGFFVMVGGGAAALTGLVFVAMTLNVAAIRKDAAHRYRAIGTLTGLAAAFVICALVLMGDQDNRAIGAEWLVVSAVAAVVLVGGYVQAVRTGRNLAAIRVNRVVFGTVCCVAEMTGAILLIAGQNVGLYWRACFVPTMHRATPGTRTLPSFSNALTFAMAFARIRSRAGSSTC
jgi:cytochrome bd-type quinol oxidase subunit 2